MRVLSATVLALTASAWAFGQSYTIQTFAGGGLPVNIPATSAILQQPDSVALDAPGNIFFGVEDDAILRVDAKTGILTLVAGNGTPGFSGDGGPATSAQFGQSSESLAIAMDAAGDLYIADRLNQRIRRVSNGVITTVAGGGSALCDNCPAISAQLYSPQGVAVDAAGDLYIADTGHSTIRKVSNGVITTVAGNGTWGYGGDGGAATSAQLEGPGAVAVDSSGNLYIADTFNSRIREVANGVITTVVGNGTWGYSGDDGPATSAELAYPSGLAVDSAGNLFIADSNRVRQVSNGVITTVAGNGISADYGGDGGPATSALLSGPFAVAVDSAGNLYIADMGNNRIREVSNGVIRTVAGDGTAGLAATTVRPTALRCSVLPAPPWTWPATCISPTPTTSASARSRMGLSRPLREMGRLAPAATVARPPAHSWAIPTAFGGIPPATVHRRVWELPYPQVVNGVISTVAGNGSLGFRGDGGPATSAQLQNPEGITGDSAGNLYIADRMNQRIRMVSNGVITTVAGNGTGGYSGDGGPVTSARLAFPEGVAVDNAGNLYIADWDNARVREVSNGVITTVAGNGTWGYSGDGGAATSAQLKPLAAVALESRTAACTSRTWRARASARSRTG